MSNHQFFIEQLKSNPENVYYFGYNLGKLAVCKIAVGLMDTLKGLEFSPHCTDLPRLGK